MPPGILHHHLGVVEVTAHRAVVRLAVAVGAGGIGDGVGIAPAGVGGDAVTHDGDVAAREGVLPLLLSVGDAIVDNAIHSCALLDSQSGLVLLVATHGQVDGTHVSARADGQKTQVAGGDGGGGDVFDLGVVNGDVRLRPHVQRAVLTAVDGDLGAVGEAGIVNDVAVSGGGGAHHGAVVEGQIAVACHTDTDLVSTVLNAVGDVQTDGADVVHNGIELGVGGGAVLAQHEGPGVARDDGILEIDQSAVGGGDVVAVLIVEGDDLALFVDGERLGGVDGVVGVTVHRLFHRDGGRSGKQGAQGRDQAAHGVATRSGSDGHDGAGEHQHGQEQGNKSEGLSVRGNSARFHKNVLS